MGFYDLPKEARQKLVHQINLDISTGLEKGSNEQLITYFSHEDTYIRKSAYLAIGKVYKLETIPLTNILKVLEVLLESENFSVRQTVINAAGEIGMYSFEHVRKFFDTGLFDPHHVVRNAVIGSVKKMGAKNPGPTLEWAKQYLHHKNKEIRREICHGIELRGRTHPQDILPMLRELQYDSTSRVRNTLIHVLGQIAYKKACLKTVISDLNSWENKELTVAAVEEIIDVFERYKSFAAISQQEAIDYIEENFKYSASKKA